MNNTVSDSLADRLITDPAVSAVYSHRVGWAKMLPNPETIDADAARTAEAEAYRHGEERAERILSYMDVIVMLGAVVLGVATMLLLSNIPLPAWIMLSLVVVGIFFLIHPMKVGHVRWRRIERVERQNANNLIFSELPGISQHFVAPSQITVREAWKVSRDYKNYRENLCRREYLLSRDRLSIGHVKELDTLERTIERDSERLAQYLSSLG